MENNDKIKTHQKVVPKENQLLFHHNVYDVDYIVEVNIDNDHNVELTFDFAGSNLTNAQKDEIAIETREEMYQAFKVGDEILETEEL